MWRRGQQVARVGRAGVIQTWPPARVLCVPFDGMRVPRPPRTPAAQVPRALTPCPLPFTSEGVTESLHQQPARASSEHGPAQAP